MEFFSFNKKYFESKLVELEGQDLANAQTYEAKQLLKMLDDLVDEGYPALSEYLQESFQCVTRLKNLIGRGGQSPFSIPKPRASVEYGADETPLDEFLEGLAHIDPPKTAQSLDEELLCDILSFSRHIGRNEGRAYIFLLRDCLLPYFFFAQGGGDGLYAYPIGRAFLRDVSGEANFDDIIRLPIYLAAEEGITDFEEFKAFFANETAKTLRLFPRVKDTLARLLDDIPYQKITVVESGYCGTMPMLLSAIDERVDFEMYTTAPCFFELYKDNIFCRRYERLRLFESLMSQDALFAYSSFKDGKFFVRATKNKDVLQGAAAEIAFVKARA